MHKNVSVADVMLNDDGYLLDVVCVNNSDHMPIGTVDSSGINVNDLRVWWTGRSIPASRSELRILLDSLDIRDAKILLTKSFGLSLSDQYWIRNSGSCVRWEDVNFFDNGFSDDIGNILFGKQMSGEINLSSPDNTSDGVLKKRWKIISGKRCLIKGGSQPFFQEPFNEVISSMLMDALGIDHAGYDLLWIDDNPYSVCEDFIDGSTELVTASRLMSNASGDNLDSYRDRFVSICMENGIDISGHMARMTLIDHIMMNTDRHLGNYGLIRDADTLEWLGPAPIYDTGTSLMCRSSTERILASISHANDDMRMENRIFTTDLDWLDVDAMFGTLPRIEKLLHSASDEYGSLEMTSERADAVLSLLRTRMEGIEEMLL